MPKGKEIKTPLAAEKWAAALNSPVFVVKAQIHVRDPQFYALPTDMLAVNGKKRIMGFPPIGIMSLSSVLKQAGHAQCAAQ